MVEKEMKDKLVWTLAIIASVVVLFGSQMAMRHASAAFAPSNHEVQVAYKKALEAGLIKKPLVIFIDYTRPSNEKRMSIFEVNEYGWLRLGTYYVAHGENSGGRVATKFSNVVGSHQSSKGSYITAETYYGKNGYSLRLDGIDKGINDNVRERYIVLHGSDYVSSSYVGRSWGCFAIERGLARETIDLIKEGAFLYVHTN